jgi:hypothetical protein
MPTYRIEIEDSSTVTRQTWLEAKSAEEAKAAAEALDWRTFEQIDSHTDCSITHIEECDEEDA